MKTGFRGVTAGLPGTGTGPSSASLKMPGTNHAVI